MNAHSSALIQLVIRRIISAIVILFGFYLFLRLVGLSAFAIALLSGTGVAQDIGLRVLSKMDVILAGPEPQMLVQELGSSTYNLAVYFWINTHKHSLLKVRSLAIKNMTKILLVTMMISANKPLKREPRARR